MNVQFYASKADFREVLRFAWDNLPGRFFEDYSQLNRSLQSFDSFDQLAGRLDCLEGRSTTMLLCLNGAEHLIRSTPIPATPEVGGSVRYRLDGFGLFHFHYVDIEQPYRWPDDPHEYPHFCQWPFKDSRVAVNSHKRARKWEDVERDPFPVDDWPWAEIERCARKIERHLRKSFVGKSPTGFGMLPGAAALIAAGPVWKRNAA